MVVITIEERKLVASEVKLRKCEAFIGHLEERNRVKTYLLGTLVINHYYARSENKTEISIVLVLKKYIVQEKKIFKKTQYIQINKSLAEFLRISEPDH